MAIEKQINIVVKETGLDTVQKQVNKLDTSLENLSDTQQGLAKSMQGSSNSVLENGGAMGLLNDATGGLAMTVKDAVEATALFTKSEKAKAIVTAISTTVIGTSTGAMKAFRIALAATGVGLLVIGLGLLIANFDKVKNAVLNLFPGLKQVGDFIGGIVDNITDFIGVTSEAERALAKLAETSDAKLKAMDKNLKENGSAYSESAKKKMEIDKQLLEDLKTGLYNESKLRKEAQIAKDNIDKENAKKEAEKLKDAQDKINEANVKAKKDKDDKIKESEEARKKAEQDAQANQDALLKELEDEADYDTEAQERKDERTKKSDEEASKRQDDLLAELEYASEKEIALAEEVKRQKDVIAQANLNIATKTADLLNQLAGKSKALQKAGIIASAGIGIYSVVKDTQAANIAAIAPPPLGLGPIAGVGLQTKNTIQGALSIASITAASAKALQSVGGGGSVSGGGSLGGGGGAPSAPSFNLVQGTGTNQIAQGLANQTQPLKAYVVGSDVTNQQQLDRNIVQGASLGG